MPGQFLIDLFMKILSQPAIDQAIVLALWARAQKTDTKVDDVLVEAVAVALGVTLPNGAKGLVAAVTAEAPAVAVMDAVMAESSDGNPAAPDAGPKTAA